MTLWIVKDITYRDDPEALLNPYPAIASLHDNDGTNPDTVATVVFTDPKDRSTDMAVLNALTDLGFTPNDWTTP